MALTNHPEDEILTVTLNTGEDEPGSNTLDTNKDNGDNASKQLNTDTMGITPEHPVYVEGKGWILAENLSIGDRLRRTDGGMAKVLAVEQVALDTPESVYNFTVKGPHTYFVLQAGVLVHNVSCNNLEDIKRDLGIEGAIQPEHVELLRQHPAIKEAFDSGDLPRLRSLLGLEEGIALPWQAKAKDALLREFGWNESLYSKAILETNEKGMPVGRWLPGSGGRGM